MNYRVCFDTNTYEPIVNFQEKKSVFSNDVQNLEAFRFILNAIKQKYIQPFIPESILIRELFSKKERQYIKDNERPEILTKVKDEGNGMFSISFDIGPNPNFLPSFKNNLIAKKHYDLAIELGFKVLRAPRYIADLCNRDLALEHFADNSFFDLEEETNQMTGQGREIIESFIKNNANDQDAIRVFAERADQDAILSCYGYRINYFCTLDHGKKAGKSSILHSDYRKAIQEKFNINIVSPGDLIKLIKNNYP